LNIDLEINNERQDCTIGTVGRVLKRGEKVNEGDEGEGMWLWASYTKQNNETSCNSLKWGGKRLRVGGDGGGDLTNVQCRPIWNCHNESPCTTNKS
jgi:hypothetical protein